MDNDASNSAVLVASEAHAITLAIEGLLGVVFTIATLTDEAVDTCEVRNTYLIIYTINLKKVYRIRGSYFYTLNSLLRQRKKMPQFCAMDKHSLCVLLWSAQLG
jgi:fluoride ion exporter CrcB/FEX